MKLQHPQSRNSRFGSSNQHFIPRNLHLVNLSKGFGFPKACFVHRNKPFVCRNVHFAHCNRRFMPRNAHLTHRNAHLTLRNAHFTSLKNWSEK